GVERRLLDREQRTFYTDDAVSEAAFGLVGLRALPYRTYQLALTAGNVAQIVADSQALSGTAFDPTLLVSEGKYQERSGQYWSVSGRALFSPSDFYQPTSAIDPFGGTSTLAWDDFKLLPTSSTDPLGNRTTSVNDYRVLQPRLVTDPNLNRTEVAFDALGMVIATAVMGKAGAGEGDTLTDPTTRLEYDLLRFQTQQEPVFVHTFAREQHGAGNPRFQETFAYSDGFGRVALQKVQAEPGDVPGVGNVAQRWVGTGRTVFNNKGNPVKQYEPYFSATSDFEDEDAIVQTGVTPILHYDPLDRVIRTELPDGSESRVELDAWRQRNFDPNDAIAGTRWLSEHQAGTADEQRAAALALKHADTPTITHLDSLGRAFLVQADNGPDPATPAGPHRLYDTRTQLDIEGNVLAITDARGVPVIQQRFDVLQRRLRIDSPDAGARLAIADVAGKPLRAWDSRSQITRARYDALQRPTHLYVAQGATERLLLRTVFGEALDPPGIPTPTSPAQTLNLRGRPYLAFDCAGLVTSGSFDFKGNLLRASRRLAVDYTSEPDWSAGQDLTTPAAVLAAVAALLETEPFDASSSYDALNRVTTHTTPDGSVTRPVYNEANLLESLFARVRGAPEQPVITNLDYNARGQRVLCAYANGTATSYSYDPKTFRLTELQTLRGAAKLQHLVYTFDPVGNIVALRDQADPGPLFAGPAPVSGDGLYEYDPLYRLLGATGREHPATQPIDTDPPLGTGLPHANDLQALLAYSETYVYDPVGNIQQMAHVAGPSGSLGWTRNYQYATGSNRLLKTSVPGSPLDLSETYTYDAHGSITSMPHLAVLDWDYADRLKHTQKGAGAGAQHTYFTYDAAGQRVRKVYQHSGLIEERIYLGGYEVYRRHTSGTVTSTPNEERQTLHVMDDQRRVAMAETKTRDAGATVPTPTTRWRFQLDNHLGSAMLELDIAGGVISYEEYHPYGSTAFHAADGNAEVSAKRYRYTGKEKDDETGLYYHGVRYYAPWLGRWTAADPIGIDGGLNVFVYAAGCPILLTDPTGHRPLDPSNPNVQRLRNLGLSDEDIQRAGQGPRAKRARGGSGNSGKSQGTGGDTQPSGDGPPPSAPIVPPRPVDPPAASGGDTGHGKKEEETTGDKIGRALAQTAAVTNLQSPEAAADGSKYGSPLGGNPNAKATLATQVGTAIVGIAVGLYSLFSSGKAIKGAYSAVKAALVEAFSAGAGAFRSLGGKIAYGLGRLFGSIGEAGPAPIIEPPRPSPPPPPRSAPSAGEAFEESVKSTFRKKIITENEIVRDASGKVVAEIDFETTEAIVEVGTSLGSKLPQLHKLAAIAKERTKRLDVIYGPGTSPATLRAFKESLAKKWGNRVRFIPHG
ncbi:MAG TPA: RHS repeat-associated core domain-containing protein, partial [Polyangiaceae bacterium]|nr:RHS repeat-associated core domain-containing protein [Polyangiaceae bacterium]